MILLALACADPVVPAHPLADPGARLVRASLLVRGHRPSATELAEFRAAPYTLPDRIDAWMAEPTFGANVRDALNEWWRTRVTHRNLLPMLGPLEGVDRGAVATSLGEAPLIFAEQVVLEGRPFTDVLTTTGAWVDPHVAAVFGLEHDPAGPLWQAPNPGSRPVAGILSVDPLWFRHITGDANAQRSRAEFVYDRLLCDGLTDLPLPIGDLSPASNAVATEPACTGCHDVLDPAAANFFGWRRYALQNEVTQAYLNACADPTYCYPLAWYEPEDTTGWSEAGLPPPGFEHLPTKDLATFASAVATDPRFLACTARRLRGWLTQTDPLTLPSAVVDADVATLNAHGNRLDALWKSIVLEPAVTGTDAPGPLLVRPEALARSVEFFTGFRWHIDPNPQGCTLLGCSREVDVFNDDLWGQRTLAGGQDGWDVLDPVHAPTATRLLARERLAFKAADHLVTTDFALPAEERVLLTLVEPSTHGTAKVKEQIAHLHSRWLGLPFDPDSEEVAADVDLWVEVAGHASNTEAWRAVVAARLADPTVELF